MVFLYTKFSYATNTQFFNAVIFTYEENREKFGLYSKKQKTKPNKKIQTFNFGL